MAFAGFANAFAVSRDGASCRQKEIKLSDGSGSIKKTKAEASRDERLLQVATGAVLTHLELRVDLFERLADAFEVGVNLHRLPVTIAGIHEFTLLEKGVALAGPGPKMAGHKLNRLVAVFDARFVAFLQIAGDGALVVRLGKCGIEFDSAGEVGLCFFKSPRVKKPRAPADFVVGKRLAGAEED